jgi:hypothetical protein
MAKTELDILRDVSQRLGGAGLAFMLTGSSHPNATSIICAAVLIGFP